jgi:uncharacterized protein YkwD
MSERSGSFSRRCAAAVATLALVGVLAGCNSPIVRAHTSSSKSAPATPTERQVINMVNSYRARHGLGALPWNANLSDKAKFWAAYMAGGSCGRMANGSPAICHSNLTSGIAPGWSLLEENVGAASPSTNLAGLESGLEHSAAHSANMLNGRVNAIGVGVAYSGNTVYVAQEFMAH